MGEKTQQWPTETETVVEVPIGSVRAGDVVYYPESGLRRTVKRVDHARAPGYVVFTWADPDIEGSGGGHKGNKVSVIKSKGGALREALKSLKQLVETDSSKQSRDLAVGDEIMYRDRSWKIVGLKGGRYQLKSDGLPTQTIDWLMLNQALDDGKARLLGK